MFEKIRKILVEQLGVSEDRVTMEANIVEDLEALLSEYENNNSRTGTPV